MRRHRLKTRTLPIIAISRASSADRDPSFEEERMKEHERCVFTADTVSEAEQVQAFLDSAGVPSMLRSESLTKTSGIKLYGRAGKFEVLVSEEDEHRARELLAAADAGEFRLDDDSEV